jgi:hypothetical protein
MTSKELDPLKSKSASVGILPVSPTLDLNQGAAQTRGTKPQSFPQAAPRSRILSLRMVLVEWVRRLWMVFVSAAKSVACRMVWYLWPSVQPAA